MPPVSPLIIGAIAFAIGLGLLIGLDALRKRTRGQFLREVRALADEQLWQFSPRNPSGRSAAFRMSGSTFNNLQWNMRAATPEARTRHCRVLLELDFPDLAGAPDLAVLPRAAEECFARTIPGPDGMREFPAGLADFDERYEVIALSRQISVAPLNPAFAQRFLRWPRNTSAPQSLRAWRDWSGCHLQASLPEMPNLNTVRYFLVLGEDFSARLPAPILSSRSFSPDCYAPASELSEMQAR